MNMKYSDIVAFWEEGREKWRDYEFEVGSVAAVIRDFFRKKLELKTKEEERFLLLFPLKEKDSEKIRTTWYAPFACVEFIESGWANVGLMLLLQVDENAWPKKQFVFKILIKKQENIWLVNITENGTEYKLKEDFQENDLESLFDEFISLIKFQTVDSLKHWLDG